MVWFQCPYLGADVELTPERERHIGDRHPDLLPKSRDRIPETLSDPDQVRRSIRFGSAKLFSRWYDDLQQGRHVVVVVVCGFGPSGRSWIITSYITKNLAKGEVEWKKS